MAPNTINAYLTFQCRPSYWIANMPWVHDVNFQEIFKKYQWPKEKQNGNKKNNKNELTVNCYRMPSTGNYVISFVFTVKLNLLKF